MFLESLIYSIDNYIYGLVYFVRHLKLEEFFYYFWPFLVFDLVRYILLDVLVLLVYLPRKFLNRVKLAQARRDFYREMPLVSVLVPGKNEGKHILRLAESLQSQTYKKFELIIVDDFSQRNELLIYPHCYCICYP